MSRVHVADKGDKRSMDGHLVMANGMDSLTPYRRRLHLHEEDGHGNGGFLFIIGLELVASIAPGPPLSAI
jgi:hypothetical protein